MGSSHSILHLSGKNYHEWADRTTSDLQKKDLWYIIERPEFETRALKDNETWNSHDQDARNWIYQHLSKGVKLLTRQWHIKSARHLWVELEKRFLCPNCHLLKMTMVVKIEAFANFPRPCLYCRLLLSAVETVCPKWRSEDALFGTLYIREVRLSYHSQPYIQVSLSGLEEGEEESFELRVDQEDGSSWEPHFLGSVSKHEWDQAESWLNTCVNSHPLCRTPDPTFLPKRLIDVTGSNDSEVRLALSDDIDRNGNGCVNYCALSYCWGPQSATIITTRQNVEEHLRGIRLLSVPQTIQDAVAVCRSLSIRYLWVDALCIIQNDVNEHDWYEHSGEMCEIYSNAHLVISADASPSSNFGFLPGRDHTEKSWQKLEVEDEKNHQLKGSMRVHDGDTYVAYNGAPWSEKESSPLLRRGWALQESILAHRLLRFTVNGISWECNHLSNSDISLMSRAIRLAKLLRIYPNLESNRRPNSLIVLYNGEENECRHITDFLDQNTPLSIFHAWHAIVSAYSARNLTYSADKLSALSGLARLVSSVLPTSPDGYLAGTWKDDLIAGLLWYVKDAKLPNRDVSPYRAPSWSWASVNGEISYFPEEYQFEFQSLLEVDGSASFCTPSPLDPFGRVTGGQISVTGTLVDVELHISRTNESPMALVTESSPYSGNPGYAPHTIADQFAWTSLPSTTETEERRGYEVLLDDRMDESLYSSPEHACLLVGSHLDTKTGGCRTWWLVLRRTLADDNRWERIGIGYFQEYSKSLELFAGEEARMMTVVMV